MDISYEYYRIFYHVAKHHSFTQAANALMNNQPNITRTIKNLEHALGCKLFIRSKHGADLTPEGQKLYDHIAVAVEHIQTAERELFLNKSLQSGTISIGASEIALHCALLPVLKEFRKQYPGVHIRVSNHSTPQAIAALKNGLVDFAVVTSPVDLPKSTKQIIIKQIREIPVCGNAYEHLTDKAVSITELVKYPLICLSAQTKTYKFFAKWFSMHNLVLSPDIEVATTDQILPMVKNDLGIGFVPEEFLANESEETGIYRLQILEEIPKRDICFIKRTECSTSIAAKELEQMLLSKT